MSSMRSASSRTRISRWSSFAYGKRKWSSRRPGVATRTSTPVRKACSCGPIDDAAEDGGRRQRRVDRELAWRAPGSGPRARGSGVRIERARRAALLADQPVQDREQERGGLAAAGHGAGEHVAALHGGRDRVVLDRRRAGEAHFLDAAQEIRMESELRERQGESSWRKNPAGFSSGTEDSPARPTFDAGGPGRPATRARRVSQTGTKGKSADAGAIIPGRCAERSCWPSARHSRRGVGAIPRRRTRPAWAS